MIDFATDLTISVGKAKIVLKKSGEIVIQGSKLTFDGKSIALKGKKIHNN
ncbi:MAG: hypothetical protein HC927_12300 [Deltaproteobacteria bacterium]|nr:hypothetical protein [Deltaproteobacteria bacterium]